MSRYSVKLLRASPEVKAFIKSFEELRLEAYKDAAGTWTIGWGHTRNVHPGQKITRTQAEDFFRSDIHVVEGTLRLSVKVPLYQKEYDALVSLVFNIGGGNFAKSTLREHLNSLNYHDAAHEILKWRKSKGRVLAGLERRRKREMAIFVSGSYA